MQIRITEDFEAFCILDFRRVQQSTLSRSPREKKKKKEYNLYSGLDLL